MSCIVVVSYNLNLMQSTTAVILQDDTRNLKTRPPCLKIWIEINQNQMHERYFTAFLLFIFISVPLETSKLYKLPVNVLCFLCHFKLFSAYPIVDCLFSKHQKCQQQNKRPISTIQLSITTNGIVGVRFFDSYWIVQCNLVVGYIITLLFRYSYSIWHRY